MPEVSRQTISLYVYPIRLTAPYYRVIFDTVLFVICPDTDEFCFEPKQVKQLISGTASQSNAVSKTVLILV